MASSGKVTVEELKAVLEKWKTEDVGSFTWLTGTKMFNPLPYTGKEVTRVWVDESSTLYEIDKKAISFDLTKPIKMEPWNEHDGPPTQYSIDNRRLYHNRLRELAGVDRKKAEREAKERQLHYETQEDSGQF